MATITTMALLKPKFLTLNTLNHLSPSKPNPPTKPTTPILPLHHHPNTLSISKPDNPHALSKTTLAAAAFASLSCCDSALAAQEIANLAEGDNRGLALLLPIIPAIAWVLYNILQPALNQFNKMRSEKAVIVGLGLGLGLGALGMFSAPSASAGDVAEIADASSSDSRGLLLLFVITPAVLWVLYNILQPALNQINRMRSE